MQVFLHSGWFIGLQAQREDKKLYRMCQKRQNVHRGTAVWTGKKKQDPQRITITLSSSMFHFQSAIHHRGAYVHDPIVTT